MSNAQFIRKLVLFPGALGDFICFLPTLDRIAGNCKVDLLARSEYSDIAPCSVRTQSLERFEVRRLFVPEASANTRVKNFFDNYAQVYSWTGNGQATFEQQLKLVCTGSVDVFPFRPRDRRTHQTDHYLSCLSCNQSSPVPPVMVRREFTRWSDEFWRIHELQNRPVLALAPGSGARQKNWPAASFQSVAQWWHRTMRGAVLVVLGPVEDERGGYECLLHDAEVVHGQRLGHVAALLSKCDVYVGNDSGITHLAGAVGVSTLSLFGPSDPRQWAPRGRDVHILAAHDDGSSCSDQQVENCRERHSLSALKPAQVIQKIEESLVSSSLTGANPRIRVTAKISPEVQTAIRDRFNPQAYACAEHKA